MFSCSNKLLKNGEYIHNFKGGHNQKIIIVNDSVLKFQNNVSMLFMDIEGKYRKKGRGMIFIPTYNQRESRYDTLPFSKQVIIIKNKRKLKIDNSTFRFKEYILNKN
jgi:hypothetical protein